MTPEEKGRMIADIICTLTVVAGIQGKPLPDQGDMFFSLAFKPDDELRRIAEMVEGKRTLCSK